MAKAPKLNKNHNGSSFEECPWCGFVPAMSGHPAGDHADLLEHIEDCEATY